MQDKDTIKSLIEQVEKVSTDFEKTNTELKRKYLLWNIEAFNSIVSNIKVNKGSFGTGYPFYALDENLEGKLPIIQEQIRYNRQLIIDGQPVKSLEWLCKSCLKKNYSTMPNLKTICKPCPNISDSLKPRKIINRLPDIDMWMICEDGKIPQAEDALTKLLEKCSMRTSDVDPLLSLNEISQIVNMLKNEDFPKIFLPIDAHIIEYSKIKELLEITPKELRKSKNQGVKPYLPISPKSYRKHWQYDDEAYNFVFDYLASFKPFNFSEDLQQSLNQSRKKVALENTPQELFNFLLEASTKSSFRRFQSLELEEIFLKKVENWKLLEENNTLDDKDANYY